MATPAGSNGSISVETLKEEAVCSSWDPRLTKGGGSSCLSALRKACKRDFWARLQCSGPGRVLTYLLLPCTLPFEYVYFRSRR